MTTKATAAQVLKRMRAGDLPAPCGGYTNRAVFDDGTRASHDVMTRLRRAGKVSAPRGSSIHSRWTLSGGTDGKP